MSEITDIKLGFRYPMFSFEIYLKKSASLTQGADGNCTQKKVRLHYNILIFSINQSRIYAQPWLIFF
jgi:hypothetical protein